ncbi:EAL domain-containing protein [[Clostridium] dakarense]|uniref:EAL domain-containing protein n=1 Tax=Faecalimicrobium dakarense TaxID=1301100 RepID=UPI0004B4C636|nr:EAL domain-containing protein [[Clostridium] dakarense]
MNKLLKRIFTLVIFIGCITPSSVCADNTYEKVFKVGFYEYKPYYFINKDGSPDGYYHDVLELLAKDLGIKFEYVDYELSQGIKKLESGELDLLVGIRHSKEREGKLIYTDHYIGTETYGVYTNKEILYGDLDKLEGLNFAFIEHELNSEWMIKFLEKKGINIVPVRAKSYDESIKLLQDNKVDVTVAAIKNNVLENKKKIYEYSAGPVYIAGSKNNEYVINEFDKILERYAKSNKNPIRDIQNKYFAKNLNTDSKETKVILDISLLISAISIFIVCIYLRPKIKKKKIKINIKERMNNNEYLLFYQPIVNPKKNNIVGFEALLRLRDRKIGIVPPYLFIKEIEENDMLFDISIWVLKRVIKEYDLVKKSNNMISDNFYISMNVSLKEIENEKFINEIINCLLSSKIGKDKICLEIIEKVGINDLEKIQKSIKNLKEAGFMIAIDDFGVEYSNLDILEKLDFDIIKLDKYFIDGMEGSEVRKLIMNFLSQLTIIMGKTIIAEGVEKISQRDAIKRIKNDKFYIQGYIYSKPVSIDEIQDIKINKS